MQALLVAGAFVVMALVVPFGFGVRYFDFYMASVSDKEQCVPASRKASVESFTCYLLGRFENRYILIGREVARTTSEPGTKAQDTSPSNPIGSSPALDDYEAVRIYVRQLAASETFTIQAKGSTQLRNLTQGISPARSKE